MARAHGLWLRRRARMRAAGHLQRRRKVPPPAASTNTAMKSEMVRCCLHCKTTMKTMEIYWQRNCVRAGGAPERMHEKHLENEAKKQKYTMQYQKLVSESYQTKRSEVDCRGGREHRLVKFVKFVSNLKTEEIQRNPETEFIPSPLRDRSPS